MSIKDLVQRREKGRDRSLARREAGGLSTLQREMNRLFDDFFYDAGRPLPSLFGRHDPWAWDETEGGVFMPSVDVSETGREVTVSVELPGMESKDVSVEVDENAVTLRGEKKEEHEEKRGSWLRREARYGSFHRVVPLPAGVDGDKAKARFHNGVLSVSLPKRPEVQKDRKRVVIDSD